MTTWFVTRHSGARAWAARKGLDAQSIAHLDPATIFPGDIVMGTLPVHVAAEVCARGARYLHLELDLPENARGRDLSVEEMEHYGARLTAFRVERDS